MVHHSSTDSVCLDRCLLPVQSSLKFLHGSSQRDLVSTCQFFQALLVEQSPDRGHVAGAKRYRTICPFQSRARAPTPQVLN